MISKQWLQNFFTEKLPATDVLAEAITFHAFEIDGVEQRGDNDILDVKITPNRGHDCLSYRGIAGEVSAILNMPLKAEIDPLSRGFADRFAQAPRTSAVSVTIEDTSLCTRYIAGYLQGVKVGPSPEWLVKSLEAMGQRSINNVVDATNLVMFNTGQPLHAFDAGRLTQKDGTYAIVVRNAREGEVLKALDAKEYSLKSSMLVIVDAHKDEAIGIGGIKGGEPAGITEATTDIILEAANFNGVAVRKTSQALKLRTDASSRFEQSISPELPQFAMQNVVELIAAIAGGTFVGYVDVYPKPQEETRVMVTLGTINRILGITLTEADVAHVFTRLGFAYREENSAFEVVVPPWRLDITLPEDLVEEVVRIIGYDKVPGAALPSFDHAVSINPYFYAAEKARQELVAQGYSEVFTSVFAEAGERAVLNKVDSVKPFMRTTLTLGLEDALKKNIPNKELLGLKEVKLFEIGTVWKDGKETIMLGTISEKKKAEEKPLLPVDASLYETLPLSTTLSYKPYSKYPYIVRDIAMWTPAGTESSDIEATLKELSGELVQKIALFDRFEKGDRTSFAFRLIFQSFKRTLTEAEANDVMAKISDALHAKGFEIR